MIQTYLALYFAISITFAYIIMTDLENLRHTPKKLDLKSREKVNVKIQELKGDLKLFLLWPWLLAKKIKNENNARK